MRNKWLVNATSLSSWSSPVFRRLGGTARRALLPALLGLVLDAPASAADPGYPTTAELRERLQSLAVREPATVHLESIGAELPLPLVTITRVPEADRLRQPALLVVAGIEPNDLAGPVGAIAAAEALVAAARTNEATRRALETSSIFFLPQMTPSPLAGTGPGRPLAERAVTTAPPVDDDHDGLIDEDGPEDLNGDGWITAMRVRDSGGDFIGDPVDDRLLMKADRARGEAGAWRLLTEGIDNDGDEEWNEDGPGGVNPNRNFPAGYRFFEPDAGRHPVSEPATRALAEFVVAHPNIALTLTFGAADNLSDAPKGEAGGKRPATAVNETDLPWLAELGREWRKALGIGKALPVATAPGSFSDWMYLHRGRLALAARPWFPALALEFTRTPPSAAGDGSTNSPASAAPAGAPAPGNGSVATVTNAPPMVPPESAKPPAKKPGVEDDKRNEEERSFLRWLDTNAPSSFVKWQRIEHPDFPGRVVEVGGYVPWARSNPPAALLSEWSRREAGFVVTLASRLPRVAIRRTEVKARGSGVFDVRVEVQNTGWLPTVLAQGETTREVLPTRVTLKLDDAAVLSGSRQQRIGPLPGGGGVEEVRWVVLAPGRSEVEVEVVSALAGRVTAVVPLKEETR